ncbi:MAG: SEL1-like repeat protein [Hyphomicrobiales bacterium]|nr:SEL1-like repeat protein [Rickettsiales bacterium]MCP5362121.1 SEL1-like repeat protein [Hyphomicrobiales bacterium]
MKHHFWIEVLVLGIWIAGSAAHAEEYSYNYYEPGFLYEQTLENVMNAVDPEDLVGMIQAANKGDVELQYRLGYLYEYGTQFALGVKTNYNAAAQWYQKAADTGSTRAMVALGKLYKKGGQSNFPRNIAEAIRWFGDAARQGDPEGLYELGILYEQGDGVHRDDKKALEIYEAAADMRMLKAHVKVGLFYQYGRGGTRDYRKAIDHFQQALKLVENENQTIKESVYSLAGILYAQIAETNQDNKGLRLKWHIAAAEVGNLSSQLFLANAYMNGDGVPRDYVEARKWFEYAARQENTYAMVRLGYIYANGFGVEQDYRKALKWYHEAVQLGDPEAAWNIGNFYQKGLGVQRNEQKATLWFTRMNALRKRTR